MSWLTFSTANLAEGLNQDQKAEAWAELHKARRTLGKSEVVLADSTDFQSELVSVQLGSVSATWTSGSPATLRRTTKLLKTDPSDQWIVLLSATERPFMGESLGREFELPCGGMALLSYDIANITHTSAIGALYSIALSRAELAEHVKDPEHLTARTFSQNLAPLKLLRTHIASLFAQQHELDDATSVLAGRHVRELICATMQAQQGQGLDDSLDAVRLARRTALDRLIGQNLSNHDFDIDQASARIGLSRRSVQHLLAETKDTFSGLLTEARLCHARALLRRRAKDHRSILDIATASGFSDISTFNRRYRAFFDERPTDTKSM